ncbi:MAG: DUF4271 domain-containing protein [Dysgonamonadaceae bacterium]|jgi:hypothetical protein|nr:DUF4271 domain-containing protein [Dysgonamonadaceae bacterium]
MTEELLSEWPAAQNGLFFLFLLCFLISMLLLGNSRHLFASMLRSLFREQDRKSIFSETVHNEFVSKLILCLQAVLMTSILIYCTFSHVWDRPFESITRLACLLGGTTVILLLILLYKFLTNRGIGYIFFSKENVQLWNSYYFSIISLSGIVLFIPALLIIYLPETYYACFVFSLIYFLFLKILIGYKIFIIFFQQKSPLLYFILYLCTQELLPVFFVLKALVYFYRI